MKKKIFISMLILTIIFALFDGSSVKAGEKVLVYSEEVEDGIIQDVYMEASNKNTREAARGYTYYTTLTNETTGVLLCEIKMTVGFNYAQADGIVKVMTFSYQVIYEASGYSVDDCTKSVTNGNPAVARLYYTLYRNGKYYGRYYPFISCNNNGTILCGR